MVCNNRNTSTIRRGAAIILAVIMLMMAVVANTTVSVGAKTTSNEIVGKTVAEVLGMDGNTYINWLYSHQSDKYYLTTPYKGWDHRNPNGDKANAYGYLDTKNVAGMNCTGFVWHVLMKATKASGGNYSIIPALSGWVSFYRNNNISRRYFSSKTEMLNSGYLEKGDIIWMFIHGSEDISDDNNHIGIYWGNGQSDVFWNSITPENTQGRISDYPGAQYCVLKVMTRGYISVKKSSTNPELTDGKPEYTLKNIEYYVSKSPTDFDYSKNGKNYLGYIKLNESGEGHSVNGSRATLCSLAPGTYYVKEGYIPSNCNYERDETVYTVKVTAENTKTKPVELNVFDQPIQEPNILGDVDNDGEVSVLDAAFIQRKVCDIPLAVDPEHFLKTADVDGNNSIDITDAAMIQRYESELPTPYKIGEPI